MMISVPAFNKDDKRVYLLECGLDSEILAKMIMNRKWKGIEAERAVCSFTERKKRKEEDENQSTAFPTVSLLMFFCTFESSGYSFAFGCWTQWRMRSNERKTKNTDCNRDNIIPKNEEDNSFSSSLLIFFPTLFSTLFPFTGYCQYSKYQRLTMLWDDDDEKWDKEFMFCCKDSVKLVIRMKPDSNFWEYLM